MKCFKNNRKSKLTLRAAFGPILTAIICSICVTNETALQGAIAYGEEMKKNWPKNKKANMVTLNVRSIPRHRGMRTVVCFSDTFACAHVRLDACARACLSL